MENKICEKFMKKCFILAKKGEGRTSPNPLVGAVLVDENNKIVGEGWHKGYGLDHAEVDCIKNYEKKYGKCCDYSKMTLFVNLEPCNHYGKTPPCADFIIKKGIKNVVIATLDPNKSHSGGEEKLIKAGVYVKTGILEDEAIKLNEVFFKNSKLKLPFLAIKTATTLDGKIAAKTGSSKWITSEKSRKYVQTLRKKYNAILTSSSTVLADNPSLTIRQGKLTQLSRIILDSSLRTEPKSKVYNNDGQKVYVVYCCEKFHKKEYYSSNVKFIKVNEKNGKTDLKVTLEKLYNEGICSILAECGGILTGAFIRENLVDKVYQFTAPKILGDKDAHNLVEGFNISDIKECRNFKISTLKNLNPDIFIEYYPSN